MLHEALQVRGWHLFFAAPTLIEAFQKPVLKSKDSKKVWIFNDLGDFICGFFLKICCYRMYDSVTIALRSPTTVYAFLAPSVHQLLGLFFAWNLSRAAFSHGLDAQDSRSGTWLTGP
jgi:hypothetical protein